MNERIKNPTSALSPVGLKKTGTVPVMAIIDRYSR
jgi:hypothetical protein